MTSSRQICSASKPDFPAPLSAPVCAIDNPIRIGSLLCAMAGNAAALTASTDNNLRAFRRNCVREKLFNLLSPNIVVTAIQMPTSNRLGWTIAILPGMDQSGYAVKNVMNTALWRGMPGEAI